jgi:TPR repeat protein
MAKVCRALRLAAYASLIVLATAPLAKAQGPRVALVIGQGAYSSAPTLANPPNDARDIAQALRTLGFEVTLSVDLDRAQMLNAIAAFGERASRADLSLFYYGGHGLQLANHNYLVPIDAVLRTAADIANHTVALDSVIDALGRSPGQRLVFLDACRENPLKHDDPALAQTGLARVGKAADFLIAFATQPDAVAFDGAGRNSPFAQGLLAHLTKSGVDLANVLISVNHDVIAATGGEQVPWENLSLTKQIYLAGEAASDASPEASLWRLAAPTRDSEMLQIYLQRYPTGPHASDARALIASAATAAASKPKDSSAEEEIWRLALSSREPRLIELYGARYPKGAHTREAEELAAQLEDTLATPKDPGVMCDRLATHPNDATASAPGVDLATLKINASAAIAACEKAEAASQGGAHYRTLQARALFAGGRFDEAVKLYRAAAEAGDARALVSLGRLEETGDHVPKDVVGAYALYEKAAERGGADGAINYAVALTEGKTMPKDLSRAYGLLKSAADAGSAVATFDLGKFADDGLGGDAGQALALFRRAAALGEPNGYRAAATLLDEGRHVPKDPEAAADELLRAVAADAGFAIAELTAPSQAWAPATVSALQRRLKAAGYYAATIDGRSGPELAPALKSWRLRGDSRGAALAPHSSR